MPRPTSGNPDTFTGGGSSRFNPASGRYHVMRPGAYHVNQVMKDGKPSKDRNGVEIPAALAMQLILQECDADWNVLPLKKQDEPFQLELKMGDALSKGVHPGYAKSIDDPDPQDLGTARDQWGNTIYIPDKLAGQSDIFAKSSGYALFTKSLLKAGFDPKIIDMMWAPGFEGLKFELAQMDKAAANKFFEFTGRDMLNMDGPFKVVTAIQAGSGGSTSSNGAAPVSINDMASAVLKDLATQFAGKRLAVPTGAAAASQSKLGYPQTKLPEVLTLLGDKSFLEATIPGIAVESSGAMTFPVLQTAAS